MSYIQEVNHSATEIASKAAIMRYNAIDLAKDLHEYYLLNYSRHIAAMKAQDMYLGVLFSMEDLSVYGYMTNTKIKFITVLTVPDVIIKDLDMKNVRGHPRISAFL